MEGLDMPGASSRPPRVAYLVSQYPAYSHAFIDAEIGALRRQGWEVHTFSVNSSGAPDHPASKSTLSLKGLPRSRMLGVTTRFSVRHPYTFAAMVWRCVRYAGFRENLPKAAVWQLFYLAQAIYLHGELLRRNTTHLHVHFANNGADVGRLVTHIGNAVERSKRSWTWSLTVHGPTDLAEAEALDLAGKVESAAFVVCISDYCLAAVKERCDSRHWGKLHVIRMGVEDDAITAPSTKVVCPEGGHPFRILFVGRLVPQKGPEVLLQALTRMSSIESKEGAAPTTELVMVGDGPLRGGLQSQAERLPPDVSVSWLGACSHEEVLSWYGWADVFCLPSYAEGLPVVLMEALAAGLPAVTTPVAGIPELIENGVSGYLVPSGEPEALARALAALRADFGLRQKFGQAGQRAVVSKFRTEANVRMLAALFASTGLDAL